MDPVAASRHARPSGPADGPLVSVLTTTYNRAGIVGRTIASALSQSYRNLELVVVDNGSTDDTWPRLRRHAQDDERVRVFRYEDNAGSGGGRNRCLAHATGKYALYLDSDDELLPGAVDRMVGAAEALDGEISYLMVDCVDGRTGEPTGAGLDDSRFFTLDFVLRGQLSGEYLNMFRRDLALDSRFEETAFGGEIIFWNRLLAILPAYYLKHPARIYHKGGEDRITHLRRDPVSLRFQIRGYEAYLAEFGADIARVAPAYYSGLLLAWAKLDLLAENRARALRLWTDALLARPRLYHASLALQLCLPASAVWLATRSRARLTVALRQAARWQR